MSEKTIRPADKRIGENIKKLRVMRGMSQQDLGNQLDLTFQQVQKYEKGTNRVSGGRIVMLAEILHVEVTDLFAGINLTNGKTARDPFHDFAAVPGALVFAEKVLTLGDEKVQRDVLNACTKVASLIKNKLQN